MSKIQSAINKLTTDSRSRGSRKGYRPGGLDESLTSPNGRERQPQIECKKSIEIDFDALARDGIIVDADDARQLRDEMRRIKWPVLNNAFGDASERIPMANVVMVCSALSGEGKTFTTVNLAMSIAAEKDFDVLLVDADIAKPHASELFGVMDYSGVTDYLAGDCPDILDLLVATDLPGLTLLPAGKPAEDASELISSRRMSALVNRLSELFPDTILLFDTSPILQTNESQVLSRYVGQILMVVAATQTPQPAVKEAVGLLDSRQPINLVVNGVQSYLKQKYRYGGYYGYRSEQQ